MNAVVQTHEETLKFYLLNHNTNSLFCYFFG